MTTGLDHLSFEQLIDLEDKMFKSVMSLIVSTAADMLDAEQIMSASHMLRMRVGILRQISNERIIRNKPVNQPVNDLLTEIEQIEKETVSD